MHFTKKGLHIIRKKVTINIGFLSFEAGEDDSMFGSQKDKQKKEEKETLMKRKNSLLERYQKAFDKIEESREDIEENFEKLVNGSVKQDQDLSDVVDSIKAAQQANSKMVDTVQRDRKSVV